MKGRLNMKININTTRKKSIEISACFEDLVSLGTLLWCSQKNKFEISGHKILEKLSYS